MFNVLKRVWKYEFSTTAQELFARQIDEFKARHPEYRSYRQIAELVDVDPALLTKLRKKNKSGEFGTRFRFLHLFPFRKETTIL